MTWLIFITRWILIKVLWNALDTNNFSFFYLIFLILYLFYIILFLILDNEEACDTAVTWCDVIGLEHGRRI